MLHLANKYDKKLNGLTRNSGNCDAQKTQTFPTLNCCKSRLRLACESYMRLSAALKRLWHRQEAARIQGYYYTPTP